MDTPVITVVGCAAVTVYVALRLLLKLTQHAKEPPAILTGIPFLGPLPGMLREKSNFYLRLRNQYNLPIYTLRVPFSRIYIVNATELIAPMQKNWRTISFAAIAADAGSVVGMSKQAVEVMHQNLTHEDSFSVSWPRYIIPAMSPGRNLDDINKRSIDIIAAESLRLRAQGKTIVDLFAWSRSIIVKSTTEAIYGPQNPYRDAAITDAWNRDSIFESGFLTFAIFPFTSLFFPKLWRARELAASAMMEYMRKGGHKQASGLVSLRYDHHSRLFGLGLDDIARGELGNTFAVLGNTTPAALWLVYHIFSSPQVLKDIRDELDELVQTEGDAHTIDLGSLHSSCPVLLSTFQETLRFRSITSGPRVLLEDVVIGGYLLKKGSILMAPAQVQHTSTKAWGDDAAEFDHKRFTRKMVTNRTAFRAFGGGHSLCPGRHFASTEILAFAAVMTLLFEITPAGEKWVEPTTFNSPLQAGIPVPDKYPEVEIKPRDPAKEWRLTFTGTQKAAGIVSEDIRTEG
ncbi:hypothetical protein S40293_02254 [Stachybotrys chartarum IBT 40293]|nr:hypothetical protein S40293_02254 [Stachybotrys chartarum IBT 40293]